jgi:signal transduction histidine kinase
MMVCDLAALGALLALTGGVGSPLLFLYFGPLLVGFFYGDASYVTYSAAGSLFSASIASFAALAPGMQSALGPAAAAGRAGVYRAPLFVVILGVAVAASRATLRRRETAAARRRLLEEKLARANDELGRTFGDFEAAMEMRRADDQQANQLRQQLLRAERFSATGKLAAGVLHDLADPLSVIVSDAEMFLLRNEDRPEKSREVMRRVLINTQHISLLLENLRLLTKQRGDQVYGSVDVKNVVLRVLTALEPVRKRRGVVVDVRVEDDALQIFGVESQFEQLVTILVVNAFEAIAHPGGRVTVRTRAAADGVLLEVEDDGEGVPKQNLDRIFEPFFTTRDSPNSLGLGLYSALAIVEDHGGKISVRSEPGVSTVFTAELPLTPPHLGGKGGE